MGGGVSGDLALKTLGASVSSLSVPQKPPPPHTAAMILQSPKQWGQRPEG